MKLNKLQRLISLRGHYQELEVEYAQPYQMMDLILRHASSCGQLHIQSTTYYIKFTSWQNTKIL